MADHQNVADEEFSLRNSGLLYPFVRNQRGLNVCYTYSSSEAMAALYAKEMSKPPIVLSTQQLVDYVPIVYRYEERGNNRDEFGCYFGSHMDYFRYVMHTPLCLERDYPGRTSRWEVDIINPIPNENERYMIGNYQQVNADDEEKINDTLKYQPMVGAIQFYLSFHNFKGQAVYMGRIEGEECLGGHSILIIGYGIQNGIKYYVIKNSVGEVWGDQGYGKVKRELIYNLAYPTSIYESPSDFKGKKNVEGVASSRGTKTKKGRP